MFPQATMLLGKVSSAGGPVGPVLFKGSAPAVAAINGSSVTINFSDLRDAAGVQPTLVQNDLVCVLMGWGTNSLNVTPPAVSGWSTLSDIFSYDGGTGRRTNLSLYYRVMDASPDGSITIGSGGGGTANSSVGVAFAFSGVDIASPIRSSTDASGTASPRPDAGSVTPGSTSDMILVCGAGATNSTPQDFVSGGDLETTTNAFRTGTATDTVRTIAGFGIKIPGSLSAFDPAAWTGGAASPGGNDSWAALSVVLKTA